MRDVRILLTQARYAIAAGVRSSNALVFGIALPIFLLVLFNEVFAHGSDKTTHVGHDLINTTAYYTAGLVAYAIMLQTFHRWRSSSPPSARPDSSSDSGDADAGVDLHRRVHAPEHRVRDGDGGGAAPRRRVRVRRASTRRRSGRIRDLRGVGHSGDGSARDGGHPGVRDARVGFDDRTVHGGILVHLGGVHPPFALPGWLGTLGRRSASPISRPDSSEGW